MTPTALLILQLCAAHATEFPVPQSSIMLTYSTYPASGNGTATYTQYAPGFEDCGAVVPELKRQQQAEEAAAAETKYKAEHADEIKQLQTTLDKLHKEQPAIKLHDMVFSCGVGCISTTDPNTYLKLHY